MNVNYLKSIDHAQVETANVTISTLSLGVCRRPTNFLSQFGVNVWEMCSTKSTLISLSLTQLVHIVIRPILFTAGDRVRRCQWSNAGINV